jgi:hypothetical protein
MIIWKSIKYPTNLLLVCLLVSSCGQSDYTKLVKSELAKGVRQDSILLGINLGDTRDEYYGRCFALNKLHLLSDGGGGFAEYIFKDSLVHQKATPIRFLIKPNFDNKDSLAEMVMQLSYAGWSPTSVSHQSDSLMAKTKKLLKEWYGGNDFISVKLDSIDVPVKLDGNRRILIYKLNPQVVQVRVQDILHPIFQHSITKESK